MKKQKLFKPTKKEIQWIVTAIVFILSFTIYFSYIYLKNCVLHWPLRWDVKVCWNEQKEPARQKASEAAAPFIP